MTGMALFLSLPSVAQKRLTLNEIKAAEKKNQVEQAQDVAEGTVPQTG